MIQNLFDLTCVIPVFNGEAYLREFWDNLLDQTAFQIENFKPQIIFVDDCSTDRSLPILQEIQAQYPDNVQVLHRDVNGRPGGARNLAFDQAQGEYLLCIDSDDYVEPTLIEKLMAEAARCPQADIIDSGFFWEREDRAKITTQEQDCGPLTVEKKNHLLIDLGFLWTKLFRREFIEQYHLRFREHVILEDNDFLAEAFARAEYISRVPEVLYLYRDTPNSLSDRDNITEFLEAGLATCKAIYDRVSVVPDYEGYRNAVEYLIMDIIHQNVVCNIEELYQAHLIDNAFYEKVRHTIHTYLRYCVKGDPAKNPCALERMKDEERDSIISLWNLV